MQIYIFIYCQPKEREEEEKHLLTYCSSAVDMIQDQHPEDHVNKQSEERTEGRQVW